MKEKILYFVTGCVEINENLKDYLACHSLPDIVRYPEQAVADTGNQHGKLIMFFITL